MPKLITAKSIAEIEAKDRAEEIAAVEIGMPAHLLWTLAFELRKVGWELRRDVFHHLDKAGELSLAGLRYDLAQRAATRMEMAAQALLREMSFDNPRQAMMSGAYFVLALVEGGFLIDPQNQAVLVATHLASDASDAGSDLPMNERVIKRDVGKMLVKVREHGIYLKPIGQPLDLQAL